MHNVRPTQVCPSRTILLIAVLLATSVCPSSPAAEPTTAPASQPWTQADTPAGREFSAWLDAFNSGDRVTLRAFLADHLAPLPDGAVPAEGMTARQSSMFPTGRGFDVRKINAPTPDRIVAFVQAKRTGYWMSIGLAVEPRAPHRILGFGFRNIMAPPELLPAEKLSDDELRRRVDEL